MRGSFSLTISRSRRVRSLGCLALWATIAWVSPSLAQTARDPSAVAADPGAAKAQFTNAQKLFKAGRFAEALPLFRDLAQSTKSPNARLYVGHCLQELGKYVEAHKAFTAVVKEITEHPDEKYQPTREAAIAQLAVLNVRLGRVIISLSDAPPNLAVTLDGNAVEEKMLGSSIVVEPGAHRVEASASGLAPIRRDVNIDGGEVKTVPISFKKGVGDEAPFAVSTPSSGSASTAPPFETRSDDGATMRTMGFVAGGVGVAGLAVFTITGLMAKSAFDDLERQCHGPCADASYVDRINRGKALQTTANVGLVVGLVGVATGTMLFVLGRPKHGDAPVSVSLSNGGGAISYEGRF
jgi:hypothetical protein